MDMQQELMPFVLASQAIIYDETRADALLKMMETKKGAMVAVITVISGIEQQKEIPKEISVVLAPIILMLLVDLGKNVYGKSPSPKVIDETVKSLMDSLNKAGSAKAANPVAEPAKPEAKPSGLIQQGATV